LDCACSYFRQYDSSHSQIGKFETTLREMLLPEPGFCLKNEGNLLFANSGQLYVRAILPAQPLFPQPPYGTRFSAFIFSFLFLLDFAFAGLLISRTFDELGLTA
jgi:hypothetical protein